MAWFRCQFFRRLLLDGAAVDGYSSLHDRSDSAVDVYSSSHDRSDSPSFLLLFCLYPGTLGPVFLTAHGLQTEVLRKLSTMHRLVVSTGGGAVIRPINWKYMQKGISVWLDVPLEALARRIADVGTESRPLLHQEPGDAYAKAFTRLSSLWEERSEAYANASARVSLENIAAKLGTSDVCNVTPTVIAIEALQQIESFLKN